MQRKVKWTYINRFPIRMRVRECNADTIERAASHECCEGNGFNRHFSHRFTAVCFVTPLQSLTTYISYMEFLKQIDQLIKALRLNDFRLGFCRILEYTSVKHQTFCGREFFLFSWRVKGTVRYSKLWQWKKAVFCTSMRKCSIKLTALSYSWGFNFRFSPSKRFPFAKPKSCWT